MGRSWIIIQFTIEHFTVAITCFWHYVTYFAHKVRFTFKATKREACDNEKLVIGLLRRLVQFKMDDDSEEEMLKPVFLVKK